MISFLDRIFLRIFGYSGKYFDWRDFPNERTLRGLGVTLSGRPPRAGTIGPDTLP